MTLNKSLNIALPKGRILDSVLPILLKVGIEPEKSFFDINARKLKFKTNINYIDIIIHRNQSRLNIPFNFSFVWTITNIRNWICYC